MARVHGVAGEWARVHGVVIGLWPIFLGLFTGGFAVAFGFNRLIPGLVLLVASATLVGWGLNRGLRKVERYFKGARGEEHVAEILRHLPETYHVFNDFVVGKHHIDHVVVGPAGVFAIETKCWQGHVTIEEGVILLNGQMPDRAPLAQAKREAGDVKRRLEKLGWKGAVTPVIAFASDTFDACRAELDGAVIMNANELARSFATDRVVLPAPELNRLVTLMEG